MNDRAAFLEARRAGIGGSDAAAVLGLSPWKTPLELYREKRGELEDTRQTVAMEWGQLIEPAIIEMYRRRTGLRVVTGAHVQGLADPQRPFMRCNLDGLAYRSPPCIVEAKLAGQDEDWGEPGTDQVPSWYIPQAQHCMAVSGYARVDFAVLFARFGLRELQIYPVPRDEELIAIMIDAERDFWQRVLDGKPPDPSTPEEIRLRWPTDSGNAIEATETIVAACDLLAQARGDEAAAKKRVAEFALPVQSFMEDAAELTYRGKTIATWRQAKPSQYLDEELLRAGHPEIAAQYTKSKAGSRRLLIKK